MKIAYLITSCIGITDIPLTYSPVRSVFSESERLRQTVTTVASVDQAAGKHADILLLDSSKNWQEYKNFFEYQQNLRFVSVLEEFPEIYTEVTTHANKSRCETLTTWRFLDGYKRLLAEYDAIVKISGRYFLDSSFQYNQLETNRLYFKRPMRFPWQDAWNYQAVRLPNTDYLYQYCPALFAWGNEHLANITRLYELMATTLARPDCQHYDMETLMYFYTRPLADYILETDWLIYGWLSPSGKFVRQ